MTIEPDYGWAIAVRDMTYGKMQILAHTVRSSRQQAQIDVWRTHYPDWTEWAFRQEWRRKRRRGEWQCVRVRVEAFGENT